MYVQWSVSAKRPISSQHRAQIEFAKMEIEARMTDRVAHHAQFLSDGFAGPFGLGSPGQMAFVGRQLTTTVFNRAGPNPDDPFVNRHLDSALVAQLCTHPAIIAAVEPLLGPDLVVWRSLFFSKAPGSRDVLWHQDSHYWQIEPPITVTAWLAIDRAQIADHCLEIIPGSHKTALTHYPAPPQAQFPEAAHVAAVDLARAMHLPVESGSFVLFDRSLVHRSGTAGPSRRLALSIRIAPAHVKIDPALLPADGRVLPLWTRADRANESQHDRDVKPVPAQSLRGLPNVGETS